MVDVSGGIVVQGLATMAAGMIIALACASARRSPSFTRKLCRGMPRWNPRSLAEQEKVVDTIRTTFGLGVGIGAIVFVIGVGSLVVGLSR